MKKGVKRKTFAYILATLLLGVVAFTFANALSYIYPRQELKMPNANAIAQVELTANNFKDNTVYQLAGKYNYLPDIVQFSEVDMAGEKLISNGRLRSGRDITLFFRITGDLPEFTLVFADFTEKYDVYVDDLLVFSSDKKATYNQIPITAPSNQYLIIFHIYGSEQSGDIILPAFFLASPATADFLLLFLTRFHLLFLGFIFICLIFALISLFIVKRTFWLLLGIMTLVGGATYIICQTDFLLASFYLDGIREILLFLIIMLMYLGCWRSVDQTFRPMKTILGAYLFVVMVSIAFPILYPVNILIFLVLGILILPHLLKRRALSFAYIIYIMVTVALMRSALGRIYLVPSIIDNYSVSLFLMLLASSIGVFIGNANRINHVQAQAEQGEERSYTIKAQTSEAYSRLKSNYDDLRTMYSKLLSTQENNQNLMLNISHDLRTPLSIIDGYLQVLNGDEVDKATWSHYFERIEAKLEYLKKLIADLFLVAKMEEGNFHLVFEEIDVVAFTNALVGDYKIIANNKGLNYQTQLTEGFLIRAIDTKQFPRIIENIITNAIKYNKKNGNIIVTTEIIKGKEETFRVIVEDTGIGIDDKDLPRIFGSYYLEKRKSNQNDSSGVGLYITKQLVDRHRGKLWVESEKEKGTKVIFEI